jgi:hypothetical protein
MRAKRNSPSYLVPNSSEGLPAIFFLRDLCESATMGFGLQNKKTELNLAKKALKQPPWSPEKRPWQQIAREKLNFNPDKCPPLPLGKPGNHQGDQPGKGASPMARNDGRQ